MADYDNLRSFPAREPGLSPYMRYVSSVQPTRITWICNGRLAAGKITVLDGDPGLGKSTMMLDWTARITTGRPLPGMDGWVDDIPVNKPRGVVLLSAEDGESDTIRPRLDLAGADTRKVVLLDMVDEDQNKYLPTIGKNLWAIESAIEASNAALLVVDPLMAYLDADVNANRDQDVRRVFSPIAAMAERTGCAVVVLRHLNKATGMAGLYRGGGSIGIIGGARFGLLAHKDNDDETGQRRLLMVQKSNIGPEALTLVYQLKGIEGTDHAIVEWLGESSVTASSVMSQSTDPVDRVDETDAEMWLNDILSEGQMAANDIFREGAKAGHSQKVLRRTRKSLDVKLAKKGFGKDGVWVWSLPEHPKANQADRILTPKPRTVSGDPFETDD